MYKTRKALLFALAGMAVVVLAPSAWSQEGSQPARLPSVGELRRRLDELERKRRESPGSKSLLREIARPSLRGAATWRDPEAAIVEIVHRADRMGGVWTLERDGGSAPIRLCMRGKRVEWIRLAPGPWRIRLRVGIAEGPWLLYSSQTARLERGRFYRLRFGESDEQDVRRHLRDQERERAAGAHESEAGTRP